MTVRASLAFVFFLLLMPPVLLAVDPSKCMVIWTFRLPCSKPLGDLVNQVKLWSTDKCNDDSEKCMYKIMTETSRSLQVKHKSPRTGKVTDINFEFTPPTAKLFCKIWALSHTTSQNATGPSDYCLIYNLIDGSGLTQAEGYKEICNKEKCPSKSSAECNPEE